ncbi:MAG: polysaccharide biosynthesis tyrosine autokinase [Acidobacteria bacterium]|nr:polysaccharide biosynthesis tyrosine autokinase [Acidobacteriota bacterium]
MQVQGRAKELSIVAVFEMLGKRKFAVAITMLLVTAAFMIYAFGQADRFRAEALLAAEPAVPEYVKRETSPAPVNIQEKLWLIRERLLNPPVLESVIREFDLYRYQPPQTFLEDIQARLALLLRTAVRALPGHQEPTAQARRQRQIEDLKSKILIQVEAADAFAIGFEGQNRQQAMDVANRLADILVQKTSDASEQSAAWAAGFLQEEVEQVKRKLDQQNEQIQQYQSQGGDVSTRLGMDVKLLESFQEQLQLKTERIANEQARRSAVSQEMKELEEKGALESAVKSPEERRLEELRTRLKQLQATYTEQYPEMRAVKAEIQDLERVVAGSKTKGKIIGEPSTAQLRYVALKAELEEIDQRLQSYRQQEKQLSSQITVSMRKVDSAPQRERTLAVLVRDYELTREEYQALLEKQQQAQLEERLSKVNQSSDFRIVRRALFPLEPSAPQRARIILLGLFIGLGLGLGLAIFSESRDTSYDSADDFQNSTNLPVLTVIPSIVSSTPVSTVPVSRSHMLPLGIRTVEQNYVVALSDPRSIAAEQYGILAMEVRERLGRDSSKVVAVTSSAGGEGKTITSLNLSIALSRTMEGRVLLLECDLRRPRLQEYVGFRPQKGFSDLLKKPEDSIEPYLLRINGLSVIPGGPVLEDPLHLLASYQTQAIFARLRQKFDFIVVDTPPLLPIADTRILAGLSDGVVLVVRARHTRRELLQHALQNFRVSNLLGVVLNGVDIQRSRYSYAYEYYAHHYLAEEKGNKRARA